MDNLSKTLMNRLQNKNQWHCYNCYKSENRFYQILIPIHIVKTHIIVQIDILNFLWDLSLIQ